MSSLSSGDGKGASGDALCLVFLPSWVEISLLIPTDVTKKFSNNEKFRVAYRVGIFRSVSVGISRYLQYRYQRKTMTVFSVSKLWREPLKKLSGSPFFLRRGGLGPLFVHFALLLKKKRNSHGIFQKKSSREILKRCSRQSLQYNNTDQKIPIPAVSDTG